MKIKIENFYQKKQLISKDPNRSPYLAMPQDAYEDLIREPIIQTYLARHHVKLIIFDIENPIIYEWKSY